MDESIISHSGGGVATHLHVTITDIATGVTCCTLTGVVDLATGPQLEKELMEAIGLQDCHVVLDVSELEFIGSIGLRIISEIHKELEASQRHLALVADDNVVVIRPLQVMGLDKILDIHRELSAAVRACRGPERHPLHPR